MNLRDLRYFVALAETKHFGKAAERCFVSQPTLSAQIKKLENYLGVQLLFVWAYERALTAMTEAWRTKLRVRRQRRLTALAAGVASGLASRGSVRSTKKALGWRMQPRTARNAAECP